MNKNQLALAILFAVVVFALLLNMNTDKPSVVAAPVKQRVWSETTQTYKQHHFYGESLHLETEQQFTEYRLIHIDTEAVYKFETTTYDQGIELETLPAGEYAVLVDDAHIKVKRGDKISQSWYTVMRNQQAKAVTVNAKLGKLILLVEDVKQLPKDVYDIIIDPGHGGLDTGASGLGLHESEEMLRFSTYVAKQLETKGFKVKLTRTTDVDPAGDESYNLEKSPYYTNGRIEQVYQHQGKLFLSNHLNSTDGRLANGFQVYSSVRTSNQFAQSVSTALQAVGMEAALLNDPGAQGEGTFTKTDRCVERIEGEYSCYQPEEDYLFAIRESGGRLTSAQKLVLYNSDYQTIPNFGAESLLIEYFFMNNARESQLWQANWQTYADGLVEAITTYLQE